MTQPSSSSSSPPRTTITIIVRITNVVSCASSPKPTNHIRHRWRSDAPVPTRRPQNSFMLCSPTLATPAIRSKSRSRTIPMCVCVGLSIAHAIHTYMMANTCQIRYVPRHICNASETSTFIIYKNNGMCAGWDELRVGRASSSAAKERALKFRPRARHTNTQRNTRTAELACHMRRDELCTLTYDVLVHMVHLLHTLCTICKHACSTSTL